MRSTSNRKLRSELERVFDQVYRLEEEDVKDFLERVLEVGEDHCGGLIA